MATAPGIDLADMRLLREEAALIQDLISRLKDQLNRLKIEEMQLESNVRENNIKNLTGAIAETILPESEIKTEKLHDEREQVNTSQLNLNVNFSNYKHDLPSAEEEEEEYHTDEDTVKIARSTTETHEELSYFFNLF
uniref:Uncharacterized protein n=1 Tax=Strigamia maritima TaxID=126957 RepID=T1JG00_STRMM